MGRMRRNMSSKPPQLGGRGSVKWCSCAGRQRNRPESDAPSWWTKRVHLRSVRFGPSGTATRSYRLHIRWMEAGAFRYELWTAPVGKADRFGRHHGDAADIRPVGNGTSTRHGSTPARFGGHFRTSSRSADGSPASISIDGVSRETTEPPSRGFMARGSELTDGSQECILEVALKRG